LRARAVWLGGASLFRLRKICVEDTDLLRLGRIVPALRVVRWLRAVVFEFAKEPSWLPFVCEDEELLSAPWG
jgi:hypothetical protein